MAFMEKEIVHGAFVLVENKIGEGEWVEAEYLGDFISDGFTVEEKATGWFARLSAPGYMDRTEWAGPFKSAEEAEAELDEMYGSDEDEDAETEDS